MAFSENPPQTPILIFVLSLIIFIYFATWFSSIGFYKNILAENSGLIFIFFAISVVFFGLYRWGKRRWAIHRYRKEIKDHIRAQDLEFSSKIVENIKKLNYQGVYIIDLMGAQLEGANLWGLNLKESNLSGANLDKTNLGVAHLIKANLHGTSFVEANLWGANLKNADLSGARLEGANLTGAALDGADLHQAKYNNSTVWPRGFNPKAAGAVLVENISEVPKSLI